MWLCREGVRYQAAQGAAAEPCMWSCSPCLCKSLDSDKFIWGRPRLHGECNVLLGMQDAKRCIGASQQSRQMCMPAISSQHSYRLQARKIAACIMLWMHGMPAVQTPKRHMLRLGEKAAMGKNWLGCRLYMIQSRKGKRWCWCCGGRRRQQLAGGTRGPREGQRQAARTEGPPGAA